MIDPTEHFGIVYALAQRFGFPQPSAQFDDLVGDGMVGLVQAAQRWDPTRPDACAETWRAFAAKRINGAMIDGLRAQGRQSRSGAWRVDVPVSLDAPIAADAPELTLGLTLVSEDDPESDVVGGAGAVEMWGRICSVATPKELEAAKLILAGLSLDEIAAELGVGWRAVYQRRRTLRLKLDLPSTTQRAHAMSVPTERIVELHGQGYTAVEIATALGIDRDTVYVRLAKAKKAQPRKKKAQPRLAGAVERDRLIVEMLAAGKLQREVAEVLGVTHHAVSMRLRRMQKHQAA